jgi:hypothetical protein
MIRKFNLSIERSVDIGDLGWLRPGDAAEEGVGLNRAYYELRCS